jgi:hypothetical protein
MASYSNNNSNNNSNGEHEYGNHHCNQCNYTASRQQWLVNHQKSKHSVCPYTSCRQNCMSPVGLRDHLMDSHYKCETDANLAAGLSIIQCKKCGEHFSNDFLWSKHRISHGICPVAHCRHNSGNASNLHTHLVTVHRKAPDLASKMTGIQRGEQPHGFQMKAMPSKNPVAILLAREAAKKTKVQDGRAKCEARRPKWAMKQAQRRKGMKNMKKGEMLSAAI